MIVRRSKVRIGAMPAGIVTREQERRARETTNIPGKARSDRGAKGDFDEQCYRRTRVILDERQPRSLAQRRRDAAEPWRGLA